MVDVKSRRVLLVICSCFVLTFGFWRCGPIAPSIPKSALRVGERQSLPSGEGQRSISPAVKVMRVQTHLLSGKLISEFGTPLSAMEIESLRNTNRATLQLDSSLISQPTALIKLTEGQKLSMDAITALTLSLSLYSNGSVVLSAHDPEATLSLLEGAVFIPNGESFDFELFNSFEKSAEPDPAPPAPQPSPSPSSG